MMNNNLFELAIIFLFLIFLSSCGSSTSHISDFYFQGDFQPSKVDDLEGYIKKLANDKNLEVYEKDRDQMEILTDGQEAFHISLYNGKERLPVLSIGNVGFGDLLTMDLLSNKTYSFQKTESLAKEVLAYLKSELDVEMKAMDPNPRE